MPSLTAIGLRTALLSGTYTAGTFETALATASTAAAFTELVNTYGSAEILVNSTVALPVITGASTARTIAGNGPAFLRACANSSYATEQLVTTTNGAALFGIVLRDNTGGKFSHWRDISGNYTRIKAWVNASGSKLKSQSFTSSGTWTKPTTLYAMSIFAVGGGSYGGYSTAGGAGGSGGEIECVNVPFASLPGANQTVTIGTGGTNGRSGTPLTPNGGNTTVGSLITASGATAPGNSSTPTAGGGTTTNGGYASFTEWESPLIAAWQCINASQQGGAGGAGSGSGVSVGSPGASGLPGSGGNPGYGTPTTRPQAGKSYGGGGGGEADTGFVSVPADATANSGGGGAGADTSIASNSGHGGSGIAVIYWLEG